MPIVTSLYFNDRYWRKADIGSAEASGCHTPRYFVVG
jgi:hypothetical protein